MNGIGFGEVYWADIPRGPAKARYTLEESKKWARTVVERIRAFDPPGHRTPAEYELAAQVIRELIDGIQAIESLLFLARLANLMSFNLKQLLIDYLGDVQVVASSRTTAGASSPASSTCCPRFTKGIRRRNCTSSLTAREL